ncbi:MAG TPA: cyclic nucleotide-binding domain-containing protein, partial [Pirellulales bacterium]|nr:cyclic nucleotide-binding domain-containing protein [Pirellulales bacterium]
MRAIPLATLTVIMAVDVADIRRIVELLATVPLCEGLDPENLSTIAGQMQWRAFAAGETLANPGEAVTEFWIVADGEIEAYLSDAHGRESLLGVIRKGETIGEVAIVQHSQRPLRFTSRTSGALLVAPARALHDWLERYPPMMRSLFRTLSQRFKDAVGIRERTIPAPRLGIIARTQRACRLAARLIARFSELGERLHVWADDPEVLRSGGQWPNSLAICTLDDRAAPFLQPCPAGVDRRVVVWSAADKLSNDPQCLENCDQLLYLVEAAEADAIGDQLRRLCGEQSNAFDRLRIIWLLDVST